MARRNGFGESSGSLFHYILVAIAVYAGYWMCTNNASFMDFVDHVKSMFKLNSSFGPNIVRAVSNPMDELRGAMKPVHSYRPALPKMKSFQTEDATVYIVNRNDGKSVLDLIKDRCSKGGGFKYNPAHRGLCDKPFNWQNTEKAKKLCATKPMFKSKYSDICKPQTSYQLRKNRRVIGAPIDCPGAKGVINNGVLCQFKNEVDAKKYCDNASACNGINHKPTSRDKF